MVSKKTRTIQNVVMALASAALFILAWQVCPVAFAGSAGAASSAAESIVKVVTAVATAVGAVFLLMGVLRFAIAHANEDGPSQQKAALLIASGIVLIGFSVLANALNIGQYITGIS